MRLLISTIALLHISITSADDTIGEIQRNNLGRAFEAAEMQAEAKRDIKSDKNGYPVHLYKLGLSMILIAPIKSSGDTERQVQIESEGCTLIKEAAKEGLLVAGVAQFAVCYSLLEELLTNEKNEAAVDLLLKTINKKDKWISYYPLKVHSFQVRCKKPNLDIATTTQTYNETLADAHELAYRLTSSTKQSDIHLQEALKLNCNTLKTASGLSG